MEITHFWAQVKAQREALPSSGTVYVVSLDVPLRNIKGGVVCGVTRQIAAQIIVGGTHKLASKDQIKKYIAGNDAAGESIRAEALQRKAVMVVQAPPTVAPSPAAATK